MTGSGFGAKRRGGIWDEYIGQWVVIRVSGISSSYGGKIVEIKDGNAYLSPFQDGHFDAEEGFIHGMNNGISLLPLMGSTVEPTTQENIEDYCRYQNKKALEERAKEKDSKESEK